MRYTLISALSVSLLIVIVLALGCPTNNVPTVSPVVTAFKLNNGNATTTSRNVKLTNVTSNSPTYYMASESADFTNAEWETYGTSPTFTLTSANGVKTVYFKTKNAAGTSDVVKDDITLNANYDAGDVETFGDIKFVWCPPGSFTMGSSASEDGHESDESLTHTVTFSEGFWLGKYEVTQAQWENIMDKNPSKYQGTTYGDETDRPVESVSWEDVHDFIDKLNDTYPELTFRLPSESEWEYACRAGTTTRFFWSDDSEEVSTYAWIDSNSTDTTKTHVVGKKSPNDWGLYDICGNVFEWVEDCYHQTYIGAPKDGTAWTTTCLKYKVFRGGAWSNKSSYTRSAARGFDESDVDRSDVGLRLVVE